MGKRKAPSGSASLRGGNAGKKRRSTDHGSANANEKLYTLADETLVLGDGDFTFSRGLVTHRGGGRNLLATSFDSEAQVKAKYSNAADCIKTVRAAGARVLHGVDATKLHALPRRIDDQDAYVKVPPFFKYIIFNFPHTGQQRVHINRALLLEFFECARTKLVKAGEVHMTLKNRPPYSNWLIEDQAKAAGLVLKERRKFQLRHFPGYHHRTTDPQAKAFEAELCITYVFVVNRSKFPFEPIAAAQREMERRAENGEDEEPQTADTDEDAADLPVSPASGDDQDDADDASEPEQLRVNTTKKPTKRKRSKRHASSTEQTESAQQATTLPPPLRPAPFVLWRPLHRR